MNRPTRLRRSLLLAIVPVVALGALGACGGDDDSSSTAGAGTSTGDTASTTTMAAGGDAPATGDAVKIADFAFQPSTLQVKAGTKVTFTNDDTYEHTATSDDGTFDSGKLAKGKTFDFTFDKPGTYAYKCSIHNSMTGKVVVQ